MRLNHLTDYERLMLRAAGSRPDQWLNVHATYIGEALALQCKGLIVTRLDGNQLQLKRNEVTPSCSST